MNSRGALINQRSSGDTLASKDRVAMTPTVQPVAAGTHRYREFDRLPERGVASVTDRDDMPSIREMPGEAPRVVETSCRPGAARSRWPDGCARRRRAAEMLEDA